MKNFWEPSDIDVGAWVCVETWPEDTENMNGLCSVTYKLGWRIESNMCMCLVAITDGLVMSFRETERLKGDAKQVLCDEFNSDRDGYRRLTREQIFHRMEYLCGL